VVGAVAAAAWVVLWAWERSSLLVMFAIGTFSLAAMLAIGAVMAAEKNFPGGRELRAPLGVGLSVAALAVTIGHAF
jgi:predicted metal-binding membrane protein